MINEYIIYLLKVSLAISLVTLPYYLFLRNDSLLVVKRAFLIGGMVLAWIFPLLVLSKPELAQGFEPTFFIDPGAPEVSSGSVTLPQTSGKQISSAAIFGLIYLAGIILLFIKNITSFIKTKSSRTNESSINKDVIITNNDQVFTIFPKIFVPKKYVIDTELNSILIHERAHIKQLHFLDLLLAEITLLLTWFNPFSWLISRMIKENHEHLADRAVLTQGVNPAHYKALLLNHALGGEVFRLGHQFNHSLTKKRFKMMKNLKAPGKGFVKYLFIIPLILSITLVVTATSQNNTKTINGKVYLEKKREAAVGASVVISETSMGTVVDMDGSFSLEVEGNPTIVISFVGYETKMIEANKIAKKPIILEAQAFKLDVPIRSKDNPWTEGATVRASSVSTIEGDPVIVLDGKVVINDLNFYDPESFESISVFKDPSNPICKKYNATSGVILITSKKQKAIDEANEEGKEVFYVVEDIPSFPGGKMALSDYIFDNMVYPEEAIQQSIIGTVTVEFNVETDGSITNVTVINSEQSKTHPNISSNIYDDAALKLIKDMPKWNPGKQRGKPVRTKVQLPVRYMNAKYQDLTE